MLLLILKSSACLATFMVFYKLFLEKENMHSFKRFYLLGTLLVSIVIPFITFTQYIEVTVVEDFVPFQSVEFTEDNVPKATTWQEYIPAALWTIYTMGVIALGFRFAKNLKDIVSKIKTNPKHKYHSFTNVLLQDLIPPHTFFNYIFVNKTKYEHNLIPKEVLLHEQTHAKQKHALDILIIEILQMVFWFNPLIYLIKKDIKLNHEFLADRAVINNGINTSQYKQVLLAFSSNAQEPELANAINYSSIKKRFTVMKTKTSKQVFWFRSLIILPILAILIYSFSEKNMVEKEVTSMVLPITQQIKTNKGATETMMNEYREFIKNFENSNTIRTLRLNRAIAIYDLMTDAQRATVKKYPDLPQINLSKVVPKTPTKTEFNSWKNDKKFAIWINGKHVKNAILNTYDVKDITHYSGNFVHNNARSIKFPQHYQFHLYTRQGFKSTFINSNINTYNTLIKAYFQELKTFINSDRKDNSELKIKKAQLDKLYKGFTKEDINVNNLKEAPPIPPILTIQQKATPKEIAEYNKLAKKYNAMPEDSRIIKLKDYKHLEYLYNLMSKKQKEQAEPYPYFPPPPPYTTTSYKNASQELLNAKKEYNLKAGQYGNAIGAYVKNKKGNITKIKTMYKEVMALYRRCQQLAGKESIVPPPPPPAPPKTKETPMVIEIKELPPPPPIPEKATPEQKKKYQKAIDNYNKKTYGKLTRLKNKKENLVDVVEIPTVIEVPTPPTPKTLQVIEVKKASSSSKPLKRVVKSGETIEIKEVPPPPAPKTPIEYISNKAKKDAKYFYKGKNISFDEAIKVLKKNPKMNINAKKTSNGHELIYLSKEPILIGEKG